MTKKKISPGYLKTYTGWVLAILPGTRGKRALSIVLFLKNPLMVLTGNQADNHGPILALTQIIED